MRHGVVHFDILLTTHRSPFLLRLEQAIERAIATLDRRIIVHRVIMPSRDERAFERAVLHPPYPRSGLIALGADRLPMHRALCKVMADGEPVATLVSDIPGLPPHHYAGIDNYQAGRTAGYWIGRLVRRAGSVLVLYGMDGVIAHDQRTRGCVDALQTLAPELTVQVSPETCDDADRYYRFVSQALKQGDLVAVYDTGYGSSGIRAALQRYDATGKVIWIGHEMMDDHRTYLQEGSMDMVIDQNPDGQVASALQFLLHASGQIDYEPRSELREFGVFTLPNVRLQPYFD
jgi:LacI family transcriptional regulator